MADNFKSSALKNEQPSIADHAESLRKTEGHSSATMQTLDDTWKKPLPEKTSNACVMDGNGYVVCGPLVGFERPGSGDNLKPSISSGDLEKKSEGFDSKKFEEKKSTDN